MFALTLMLYLTSVFLCTTKANQTCGQQQTMTKGFITNGYNAQLGSWPWHGAMFVRYPGLITKYLCGVTIVTKDFVVTAAHCTKDPEEIHDLPVRRVYVKVGQVNLDASTEYAQQHNVDLIICHEEFHARTFENDIALMRLHTVIRYSFAVQPICLWSGDKQLKAIVGKLGYIVGWGKNENYEMPADLNEARIPIVSKRNCVDSDLDHYMVFYHETKTFCAGYTNGTSAWSGDSGGGLYLEDAGRWYLRGIISNAKIDLTKSGTNATSFVIFTDVSNYVDWIRNNTLPGSLYLEDSSEKPVLVTESPRVVTKGSSHDRTEMRFIKLVERRDTQSFEVPIDHPGTIAGKSLKINITVSALLADLPLENLNSRAQLPSGKGEESVISQAKNAVILHYTHARYDFHTNTQTARNYFIHGFDKVLQFRRSDGSFSNFGQHSKQGSTFLTALFVKSVVMANEYIYIDKRYSILQSALEWLVAVHALNGRFEEIGTMYGSNLLGGIGDSSYMLTSYVSITFLEAMRSDLKIAKQFQSLVENTTDYIANNLNGMHDNFDLAIATYALTLNRHEKRREFQKKLIEKSTFDPVASQRFWETGPIGVETAGYALLSFVEEGRYADATDVVRWLKVQYDRQGFATLQEILVGLQALGTYIHETKFECSYEVIISSQHQSHTINVGGIDALETQEFEVPSSTRKLNITAEGQGYGDIIVRSYQ